MGIVSTVIYEVRQKIGEKHEYNTCSGNFQHHEPAYSEREVLLAACPLVFCNLLPEHPATCTLRLQIRDNEWGGIFEDYIKLYVENRSLLQLFAVPCSVGMQVYLYRSEVILAIIFRQEWRIQKT